MSRPDGTDVLAWVGEWAETVEGLTLLRRRQRKEGRCTEHSRGRSPSAAGEPGEPEVHRCRWAGSGVDRDDWCDGCKAFVALNHEIHVSKATAKRLLAKIRRAHR